MCELLEVSRSGYYKWCRARESGPSPTKARRAELDAKVAVFHKASDGVYGAPRILADLRAGGERVSRKTVAASRKSSWPPPNGWTGSTTAASTSTAETSRLSIWRRPITLNTGDQPPAEFSNQKSPDSPGRFNPPKSEEPLTAALRLDTSSPQRANSQDPNSSDRRLCCAAAPRDLDPLAPAHGTASTP